ncbi:MAG: CapA family protein, partial [Desulfuromusa sp.]|nr:CapA family protein [Desulfuromusa sp.]
MTVKKQKIRLAAVGDLLLTTPYGTKTPGRGMEALSEEIVELFSSCDIVFANLECTLPGKESISSEPRVFATDEQLQSLTTAGINLVTLSNNHAFDAFDEGFDKTTQKLNKLGIVSFGAGHNINAAATPAIFTINGISIAFLAAVDKATGMQQFADQTTSGVPHLDTETICAEMEQLKTEIDHIVLAPHWGEERFRFPSPRQIDQARTFADSGATLILGHHPHVLQGMECYQDTTIAYSLGNFFVNNIYWENGDIMTWSRFERSSCILLIELDKNGVISTRQVPIYDDGEKISIEKTGWGEKCIKTANDYLTNKITPASYQRETFRVRTIRPLLNHLNWSKLIQVRPQHVQKTIKLFFQGLK